MLKQPNNFSYENQVAYFWSRSVPVPETGCRVWTRSRLLDGYGSLRWQKKSARAHRVAWEITYGTVPPGLSVLHKCDNPSCCNPEHLFIGTQADNVRDMVAKGRLRSYLRGRTHCKYGHLFDVVNTYREPATGIRKCRICNASDQRRRRVRRALQKGSARPKVRSL